jgi:precorrin-6A/cobalt-precorrin-6A reductase
MKILILGGTTEARQLAGALDARGDAEVILSLAGRTASPRAQGVPTRIGGLGARETGVPFLALRRAPWHQVAGDRWIDVATVAEAVSALGPDPVRAFLALGRKDITPFESAPQHAYLVRSVDPIEPPLAVPRAQYLTARGPFSEADDRLLLEQHGIEVLVSKNSGGEASYGKIAAARALHIPVVMIQRPALPEASSVATVSEALAWCDHALTVAAMRGV